MKMTTWIEEYDDDPKVKQWLEDNPPSDEWKGTPEEWAYTEMPCGFFSSRPGKIL